VLASLRAAEPLFAVLRAQVTYGTVRLARCARRRGLIVEALELCYHKYTRVTRSVVQL